MNRRFVSKVLLFPKLKIQLKGRRLKDFKEIQTHLQTVLTAVRDGSSSDVSNCGTEIAVPDI
jgi:hypothetical protein